MRTRFTFLLLFVVCIITATANPLPPFEFRDGDRVVFLGDTLMEREQYYGYVELALATRFPEGRLSFRNLGWSGDTPEGVSRMGLSKLQAGHEPADEGWRQLLEQIELTKPTVVFIGYGMANSFDGEKGVKLFTDGMNRLIDAIQEKMGKDKVRFVLVSPIRHENLGSPLPDPAKHNNQIRLYTDAIRQIAEKRGLHFISLFDQLKIETGKKTSRPLTDNGIHLNAYGYQRAAEVIEDGLGWRGGKKLNRKLAESVRREILKKNENFFNRSRPQNMAYILGFRKHEQGKNAAELPMFDPLLEAMDEKIARMIRGEKFIAEKPVELPKYSKPFTPQALPDFQIAEGFEVNLYAENPQLAKPIQMNFDAQGRLWIASSAVYPQIEPGQRAEDKIVVLEDTNGDGRSDKATDFAEGLFIPTAVIPGDGGVYVGQSTELLFFKDTNGDGKADQRRTVLSGFGTEDTHHTIHTLRWGPDGQLYFNQSIYIRTDTETPHEVVRLRGGGIFNLRPSSMELDVFLRGFCNTWGHVFDEFGQSFTTDGCGGQGISYGIRDAMYFTYPRMRREMRSISPGSYPKFCGLELIRSEHFPADWQGNLVSCDFRANRMVRFKITEDGAGYAAQEMPELMRTTNNTFRPIDVKLGPDGALYIADWSNPIINHGEVDFRDPRRDRWHGRIWRVTAKNRPLVQTTDLTREKTSKLLNQLLSPNDFTRIHARRVLTERGSRIERDLAKWTKAQTNETAQLEALWIYQSLGMSEAELLNKVLAAKDGRVRAAGVRVLSFWLDRLPNASDLLADRIKDQHPRVRLEAVRAIAKIPSARSAELVLSALDQPVDTFLDYGIWLSINDLAQPWVDAVRSGAWKADGREKQLEFGMKAIEPALANSVFELVMANRTIPSDGKGPWIELVGESGTTSQLGRLLDQLLTGKFNDAAALRVLNAFDKASRLRGLQPTGDLAGIGKFLSAEKKTLQLPAAKLVGTWKLEKFTPELLRLAEDKATAPEVRKTAFASLREVGGTTASDGLVKIASSDGDPSIRRQAAVTAAGIDIERAMPEVIKVALLPMEEAEATEFWRSLLGIKNAGAKVAKALPSQLPTTVARPALKVAREGGRNEADLVFALTSSSDLDDSDKALTADEMKQLAEAVTSKGDPVRGEKVYRRAELACLTCHAIGGAGGKVGPDMTSIGASAPVDYLIESLLLPNAKVKEGYHSIQISTKDEQEFSGVMVRETETEVIIRDASNKEVAVPKNDIDQRKTGGSLMPSGLVNNLSSEDRLDLFRFLTELGKPGPFDASKGNVARSWRICLPKKDVVDATLAGTSTMEDCVRIYATVDGKLLKGDLQGVLQPNMESIVVFANLQLGSDASVRLKISGLQQPKLWIDGKQTTLNGDALLSLNKGKHSVALRLDPRSLPEHIRLETSEGTFLLE